MYVEDECPGRAVARPGPDTARRFDSGCGSRSDSDLPSRRGSVPVVCQSHEESLRRGKLKNKRSRKKCIVIAGNGDPCPRCGNPMQIREYAGLNEKQERRPSFYTRWFCCLNKACKTTLVMPLHDKAHSRQIGGFLGITLAAEPSRCHANLAGNLGGYLSLGV